jgi:hypothetical protein
MTEFKQEVSLKIGEENLSPKKSEIVSDENIATICYPPQGSWIK